MPGLKSQDTPQKLFKSGNLQAQKGGWSSPFCGSRCQMQSELNRSHSVVEATRGYDGLIQSWDFYKGTLLLWVSDFSADISVIICHVNSKPDFTQCSLQSCWNKLGIVALWDETGVKECTTPLQIRLWDLWTVCLGIRAVWNTTLISGSFSHLIARNVQMIEM